MKRLLLLFFAIMPLYAFATDEVCPAGYQPEGYVMLEYIESTGTQYIDTGYYANYKTEWTVRIRGKLSSFGYIDNTSGSTACNYISSSQWAWYSYKTYSYTFDNNEINTIAIRNKELFINDELIDTQTKSVPDTWISPYTFTLFGLRRNSTEITKGSAIIYKFIIKENNTTIRDLVPVRRLSDNAVGMFDKVNNKFYGNDGSGKFIAGPETGHSFIIDGNNAGCVLCPDNTYKPNAGNVECTKCPTGTFSPIGSTSIGDCAKILHVGEYVVYMPLGKRTEHGLCVMWNGEKYCADVYKKQ